MIKIKDFEEDRQTYLVKNVICYLREYYDQGKIVLDGQICDGRDLACELELEFNLSQIEVEDVNEFDYDE
jgi:hypothetical protein